MQHLDTYHSLLMEPSSIIRNILFLYSFQGMFVNYKTPLPLPQLQPCNFSIVRTFQSQKGNGNAEPLNRGSGKIRCVYVKQITIELPGQYQPSFVFANATNIRGSSRLCLPPFSCEDYFVPPTPTTVVNILLPLQTYNWTKMRDLVLKNRLRPSKKGKHARLL